MQALLILTELERTLALRRQQSSAQIVPHKHLSRIIGRLESSLGDWYSNNWQ